MVFHPVVGQAVRQTSSLTKQQKITTLLIVFVGLPLMFELVVRVSGFRPQAVRVDQLGEQASIAKRRFRTSDDVPELVFETPTGWRVKPWWSVEVGRSVEDGGLRISTDGFGFRYSHSSAGRPENILVLGDGVTFAAQVSDAGTFAARASVLAGGEDATIGYINAGCPRSGTMNQVALLAELIDKINVRAVVLAVTLDDAAPSPQISAVRLPSWLHQAYGLHFFLEKVAAYRAGLLGSHLSHYTPETWRRWEKDLRESFPPGDQSFITHESGFNQLMLNRLRDWGHTWHPEPNRRLHETIIQLQRMLAYHGVGLGVLMLPVKPQVETDLQMRVPQESMLSFASRAAIPVLDALPIMRDSDAHPDDLFLDDRHLSSEGHALIAGALHAFVTKHRSVLIQSNDAP